MEGVTLQSIILAGPVGMIIMFVTMRLLFKDSLLFKIGISTGTAIILVAFLSGTVARLSPIHNVWVFPLQVVISVAAYIYVSRQVKTPLLEIINRINQLSQGNLEVQINQQQARRKDEIGEIERSMAYMVSGLKATAQFARQIGEGKLEEDFNKRSDEDELGEALMQMRQSLKSAREHEEQRKLEDKRRTWITEGQARFADILRQNTSNMEELSFDIIKNLVKYMDANQGGLFILNDDDARDVHLEMTACYAFDRRKFLQKQIAVGEGLVGTCYLEAKPIYMEAVPQDYIRITSGLGGENPSAVLIVPLKLNEEIFGVIELASFRPIDNYQIEFVEKVGEIIASTISSVKINNRTSMLLEKSQQQAEEMRAQEEEMRQNMEELSATQEAMAEKDQDNQQHIAALETEIIQLKQLLAQKQA